MKRYKPLLVILLVLLVSSALFLVEKWLDSAFSNGDGIIYNWNFHSRLTLFHFLVNIGTIVYFMLRSSKEWLKGLGLSIISFLFILLIVELVYFALLSFRPPVHEGKLLKIKYPAQTDFKSAAIDHPDPYLGYHPVEGGFHTKCFVVDKDDTTKVYDLKYSFDQYSRRITPPASPSSPSRFALFFGGSFTFGEGIEAGETLPYYFSRQDSQYAAYNYGYSGYGPNQMLSQLRFKNIPAQIFQQEGIAVFTYINDHVKRANGFCNFMVNYGSNSPCYKWQNGEMIFKGRFRRAKPLLSYLYFLLHNSYFKSYYYLDFPLRIGSKQLRHTARIIEESYNSFKTAFGDLPFYLIIFPGNVNDISPYITNPDIKILDYSIALGDVNTFSLYPPYEMHPNAQAYQKIAQMLYRDLE